MSNIVSIAKDKAKSLVRITNTSRFDRFMTECWQASGIAGFHFQDKRLTENERDVLISLASRLYGFRSLK